MEIRVQSLKFDADQKLLAYVDKKVSKLAKFFDGVDVTDVTLSLLQEPDNKAVKILTHIPGEELVIERNAKTFEEAVTDAVDAMKEKIVRIKEQKFEK
jgi:ribosome-associated translation inhibitor RaiA